MIYHDHTHDFNRNNEINNNSVVKNSEPKILFPFTLSWFSQSGIYVGINHARNMILIGMRE